jgi:hypothetical protein
MHNNQSEDKAFKKNSENISARSAASFCFFCKHAAFFVSPTSFLLSFICFHCFVSLGWTIQTQYFKSSGVEVGRRRDYHAYFTASQSQYYPSFSIGVTILLSLTVFMMMVAEMIPPTSRAVPLIGEAPDSLLPFISIFLSFRLNCS